MGCLGAALSAKHGTLGFVTTEILTPWGSTSAPVELSGSGLWRKQILRFCDLDYRDPRSGETRKIRFDKDYAKSVMAAFRDRAYDQVPFQLADAGNNHNNDPRNTGGEIVGLELSQDGTGMDGILRLWGQGDQVVTSNTKLGVSVRILENLEKNGRMFPRALQHVLGTVDPQMVDMHPWQRVELSNHGEVTESLDLSGRTYGRGEMPETKETTTIELSTDQLERLKELLNEDSAEQELIRLLGPADVEDEDDDKPDEDEELTDEEIAQLLADDDDDDEDPPADTKLSRVSSGAVELANSTIQAQGAQITELTNALNETRVNAELERWREAGLAPALIRAARPLLEVPVGAVELSNGSGTRLDPAETVRELLTTMVDLANGEGVLLSFDEIGTQNESDPAQAKRSALVDQWEQEYPV